MIQKEAGSPLASLTSHKPVLSVLSPKYHMDLFPFSLCPPFFVLLALIISFLLFQVAPPLVLYIVVRVTLLKQRSHHRIVCLLKILLCGPQVPSD